MKPIFCSTVCLLRVLRTNTTINTTSKTATNGKYNGDNGRYIKLSPLFWMESCHTSLLPGGLRSTFLPLRTSTDVCFLAERSELKWAIQGNTNRMDQERHGNFMSNQSSSVMYYESSTLPCWYIKHHQTSADHFPTHKNSKESQGLAHHVLLVKQPEVSNQQANDPTASKHMDLGNLQNLKGRTSKISRKEPSKSQRTLENL